MGYWLVRNTRPTDGGGAMAASKHWTLEEPLLGMNVLSPTEAFAVGIHAAPPSETASLYHTNEPARRGKQPRRSQIPDRIFATHSRKVGLGVRRTVWHQPNFAPTDTIKWYFHAMQQQPARDRQITTRNRPCPRVRSRSCEQPR